VTDDPSDSFTFNGKQLFDHDLRVALQPCLGTRGKVEPDGGHVPRAAGYQADEDSLERGFLVEKIVAG